jgi:hypothetical protein
LHMSRYPPSNHPIKVSVTVHSIPRRRNWNGKIPGT